MSTYAVVKGTQNILSSLIENINSDGLYKTHVIAMAASENQSDVKKAALINETIQNIRVFNTKARPLILARDVGILLGLTNISSLIKKFEPEERVAGYISGKRKAVFLTKLGLYRCFYVSRSPLAKLFRKFIANLLEHMIEHEAKLLHTISTKLHLENPDLVEKGIDDLCTKLVTYEKMYLEEKNRADSLENHVGEISMDNSIQAMQIKQLSVDKKRAIDRINIMLDDVDVDEDELMQIKKKYMKEMHVYMAYPAFFKKMLLSKSGQNVDDAASDMDNYTKYFENVDRHIDRSEILYLHVGFSKNIEKNNRLKKVATIYVIGKKHFVNILKELSNSSTMIELTHTVFKTSVDEICSIASSLQNFE